MGGRGALAQEVFDIQLDTSKVPWADVCKCIALDGQVQESTAKEHAKGRAIVKLHLIEAFQFLFQVAHLAAILQLGAADAHQLSYEEACFPV